MQRRNFIKTGSAAGLTLATIVTVGTSCNTPVTPDKTKSMTDTNTPDNFVLNEVTIATLQQKIKSGEHTARSIAELYLKRIGEIDKNGPKLNSVIELNPDALNIADDLDKERKAGKVRGPLHGIPVLVKDNINTGDKMMTTAGAMAMEGNHAAHDAFIIKQLRAAGAVILGKTNLSEWANFRSAHSTSAWSSRGGQTKMPYILDRNPSGSSSGSGSAVAANLCAVAIGTETDGSVISPSSINGIVGIKPTVGLLSRSGIIPISKTQDTAGPMARTVTDAALLLNVLTGVDPDDAVTENSKGKAKADYTAGFDVKGLQGKRIGIEKAFLTGKVEVVNLLREAIAVLKSQGAEIVEIELLKELKDIDKSEFIVLLYEFKEGLNKYLAAANAKMKTLADVVAFNKQNAAKAMPYFKQETLELALAKGGLESKEYLDALKLTTDRARNAIDKILNDNRLDAIAGPANPPASCIDLVNGDYDTGPAFYSPAAIAGYPNITIPMGEVYNLPVGLAFFSTAYHEAEIIQLAYAFEQATKKRAMPQFITDLLT